MLINDRDFCKGKFEEALEKFEKDKSSPLSLMYQKETFFWSKRTKRQIQKLGRYLEEKSIYPQTPDYILDFSYSCTKLAYESIDDCWLERLKNIGKPDNLFIKNKHAAYSYLMNRVDELREFQKQWGKKEKDIEDCIAISKKENTAPEIIEIVETKLRNLRKEKEREWEKLIEPIKQKFPSL